MSRVFKFLAGAIMGGVLGGLFALLLAPASGTEMRRRVNNSLDNAKNEISRAAAQRRIELEEEIQKLRQPRIIS